MLIEESNQKMHCDSPMLLIFFIIHTTEPKKILKVNRTNAIFLHDLYTLALFRRISLHKIKYFIICRKISQLK